MSLSATLAIYFIIWWLTLFTVLPFGIRSHLEEGTKQLGHDAGAPVKPQLLKKFAITTVISGVIFGIFYWAVTTGRLDFENLPFWK
jgi:predicted secreted protein